MNIFLVLLPQGQSLEILLACRLSANESEWCSHPRETQTNPSLWTPHEHHSWCNHRPAVHQEQGMISRFCCFGHSVHHRRSTHSISWPYLFLQETNAIHVNVGAGSYLEVNIPMTVGENGTYEMFLICSLLSRAITSYNLFIDCFELTVMYL